MTDTSNRRREPKGVPTGGRFAAGSSGMADAADLSDPPQPPTATGTGAEGRGGRGPHHPMGAPDGGRYEKRPESTLPPVGSDWQPRDAGRYANTAGDTLLMRAEDWYDPELGDCSQSYAAYDTADGRTSVSVADLRVEGEGVPDITRYPPERLAQAGMTATRLLESRMGAEPAHVEVTVNPRTGKARASGVWPTLPEPAGFHPLERRRVRRENERRRRLDAEDVVFDA